ncbi:MAG: diguanylate cyclase [Gemmatimonadetes bacterium]|nr:GGDEF domain-containing protein [Gemmatimonadota bacterium]NIQ60301.1 GGDEF domain-containing protein [Gemmatimonadota bacterium]NIU80519.1 diguanylate cyclase [Gammaproteobacteria bacterium]NIX48841.1 diguanylate cyclase [Gemmatimonadota bacterium]NIY13297.1 diguanylate cyclase [Gemmatimonadota bacterium]
MAVWYFGKPEIPLRLLVLSFAALLVPVLATFWFPESTARYELLLWLLALVPAFLLAYYRGWTGVAIAMLVGMAVLSLVQVVVIVFDIRTDWVLLLGVVSAYIAIGVTIGFVSELLHTERARAERLALMDDLTEMPNRRLANLFLEKEFAAARRGRELVVVLFDLDRFKQYNDRHGHAAGDDALRTFVGVLQSRTRRMDLSARYGGEEFVAILSGGGSEGGRRFAESVREELSRVVGARELTVSAGVAEYTESMESGEDLMEAADRAMYRAKQEGRDRVCVAGE